MSARMFKSADTRWSPNSPFNLDFPPRMCLQMPWAPRAALVSDALQIFVSQTTTPRRRNRAKRFQSQSASRKSTRMTKCALLGSLLLCLLVQPLTCAPPLQIEPRRATRELLDEVGAEGNGDENSVIALLRDGADPNAKSSRRTHPLFEAAKHGHFKAIQTLVKHGADADATNGEVCSAFMTGCPGF